MTRNQGTSKPQLSSKHKRKCQISLLSQIPITAFKKTKGRSEETTLKREGGSMPRPSLKLLLEREG